MATAREFVDFWIANSVHADEQMSHRRGREEIQSLADRMVTAAKLEGFSLQQMEAEIGDLYTYIRAHIDSQNVTEGARLRLDGQ